MNGGVLYGYSSKKGNMEQELLLQMLDRGINDIRERRVYAMDEAFEKANEIRRMRENDFDFHSKFVP